MVSDPQPTATDAERPWLTPGVRGIGAASFLADVGHEVPTALLPNLLTATLGAPAAVTLRTGTVASSDHPNRRPPPESLNAIGDARIDCFEHF